MPANIAVTAPRRLAISCVAMEALHPLVILVACEVACAITADGRAVLVPLGTSLPQAIEVCVAALPTGLRIVEVDAVLCSDAALREASRAGDRLYAGFCCIRVHIAIIANSAAAAILACGGPVGVCRTDSSVAASSACLGIIKVHTGRAALCEVLRACQSFRTSALSILHKAIVAVVQAPISVASGEPIRDGGTDRASGTRLATVFDVIEQVDAGRCTYTDMTLVSTTTARLDKSHKEP